MNEKDIEKTKKILDDPLHGFTEKQRCQVARQIVEALEAAEKKRMEETLVEIESLFIGVDGCEFEERLDGDKGCLVLDMNQNQWDEFKSRILEGKSR